LEEERKTSRWYPVVVGDAKKSSGRRVVAIVVPIWT
jgi:hypothetical protein